MTRWAGFGHHMISYIRQTIIFFSVWCPRILVMKQSLYTRVPFRGICCVEGGDCKVLKFLRSLVSSRTLNNCGPAINLPWAQFLYCGVGHRKMWPSFHASVSDDIFLRISLERHLIPWQRNRKIDRLSVESGSVASMGNYMSLDFSFLSVSQTSGLSKPKWSIAFCGCSCLSLSEAFTIATVSRPEFFVSRHQDTAYWSAEMPGPTDGSTGGYCWRTAGLLPKKSRCRAWVFKVARTAIEEPYPKTENWEAKVRFFIRGCSLGSYRRQLWRGAPLPPHEKVIPPVKARGVPADRSLRSGQSDSSRKLA